MLEGAQDISAVFYSDMVSGRMMSWGMACVEILKGNMVYLRVHPLIKVTKHNPKIKCYINLTADRVYIVADDAIVTNLPYE